jgi:1-deoxy-D-xylulose-5-phosphate reductoisomerase
MIRGRKKRVAILGSTGSVGTQSIEVVDNFRDRFEVVGLCAERNFKVLAEQVLKYKPKYVWISNEKKNDFEGELKRRNFDLRFEYIPPSKLVLLDDVDLVVVGIPGFSSVEPVFYAVSGGKEVAVASKEAILCAGSLIFDLAKKNGAKILPVDSEHSSLWKIIDLYPRESIKRVFLTASGGPLWNLPKSEIENAPYEKVIKHPVWSMGTKITVDSASLMNKAFEIIEACYLFSLEPEKVSVKIHPEAIVHSAVELKDGTTIFSSHFPDMRIPIMYAMLYPEIPDLPFEIPSIWDKTLRFFDPDFERFPSLLLGWKCAKLGGPFPCILVSADDVAFSYFVEGKIRFWDIYSVVEKTISYFEKNKNLLPSEISTLGDIIKVSDISKQVARNIAEEHCRVSL